MKTTKTTLHTFPRLAETVTGAIIDNLYTSSCSSCLLLLHSNFKYKANS